MKSPEANFTDELDIFYSEMFEAIAYFYCFITIRHVYDRDQGIRSVVDQTPTFRNTLLRALLTSSLVALGRIFDKDKRTHNIDRLLRIAKSDLSIFSTTALAERKRRLDPNADQWLPDYLRKVYVPTSNDIKKLCGHVKKRRTIYTSKYEKLRNKVFAHRERLDSATVSALFKTTQIRELEKLLIFLHRLYTALSELLINGRKPILQPARYSVRQLRKKPSPLLHRVDVQERITWETEQFLSALARPIPPEKSCGD